MKSIGFKLKKESGALRKIRLSFYITAIVYFVFDLFFSFGLFLTLPEALRRYTVPMLVFSGLILLSIIFVRLRLYITSSVLMTISTVGTICVGFMLRNPTIFPDGMTFEPITKYNLIFNFLPVLIPFIAMMALLIPAFSERRAQRIDEEETYTPQFQ